MANIFEQQNKKQLPPSFKELKEALPEELRNEFQELGEKLEKISLGAFYEVSAEKPSEEEKRWSERYEELEKIAERTIKERQD